MHIKNYIPQAYGQNPVYDARVKAEQEGKRAFYAQVVAKHAQETELRQQQQAIDDAWAVYKQKVQNTDKMKEKLAQAERAVAAAAKEASEARRAALAAESKLKAMTRQAEKPVRVKPSGQLRQEALERGEKTFLTGVPCKHGHYARRYTSSGACVECDKIGWSAGQLKSKAILTDVEKP
jgi:FKBP-type peptidyl-prolyl cis-trans isomerase